MSKKVSLGTKWAFQEIEDPSGKMTPLYAIEADGTTYRIMPSRSVPGEWNLDVHKRLSGWEDAVSGKTFKTPEAAAKALVKMHAETQSKASVKNIQTQLRSARPGFYEERSMGNMRAILEQAEVDEILREAAESTACASKYMDPKTGRFKGGKGERFDNCVKMMQCKGGVDDPEALCAKIARGKGLAPGGKSEDLDEAVGANIVTRMAEAMLGAPKLEVLMTRVFDDEGQAEMFAGMVQGPLEALIAKGLDAAGLTVSGGVLSKSNREMRGAARGPLEVE